MTATPKTVRPKPAPYAQITLAGTGPVYGGPESQEVRGRFNRLVVLREGSIHDQPVIRIETLTYGHEGCCSRLIGVRQIDLNHLVNQGLRLPEPTTSEIKSMDWLAADAATLRYGTVSCILKDLNEPKVKVSCAP